MTIGPGKYDDLATLVRERSRAGGVVVLVMDGDKGQGFSVQANLTWMLRLPATLRLIADQIEADLEQPKGSA